jgi:hypothetical protein
MNADIFAKWLRIQGYHVIHTISSYWYEAGSRVYQAFPYHWTIQPSEEELSGFMHQARAIGLRYSTPIIAHRGAISYHAVYEGESYTLEGLDRRSRQNVRKGLKNCSVEPISFERLAEEGWRLERDTLDRQGRRANESEQTWRLRCKAAADLAGFKAWGALVNGNLAASLLTFQMDDCCEMISQQCHRDYLNARVNNALTFVVTQTMINRPDIRSIFYALHSLDAPASIDEFKFRMGYHAKPVRQRVMFSPWFAPFESEIFHKVLIRLLNRDPGNQILAKAEGMLRFYLQGKLPLDEQVWPERLAQSKSTILQNQKSGEEITDRRIRV